MESVRTYLLSILSAALLCSILLAVTGKKGAVGKFMQLLCGLFMAICVLSPVVRLQLDCYFLYSDDLALEADSVARSGSEMAEQAMEDIIIKEAEAYILDKAASMGAVLEVAVELNDRIPSGVVLRGAASPAVRSRLTAWIADNLGIPSEAQKWI